MGDGHLNKCKQCTIQDTEERRKRLEMEPGWALAERERHRKKAAKQRLNKTASKSNPETNKLWIKRNQHKRRAHNVVSNALRDGRLHRHPCCICGNKAQAHHEDYSKPLEVIWFCPKHHGQHHASQRDQEVMKKLTNQ